MPSNIFNSGVYESIIVFIGDGRFHGIYVIEVARESLQNSTMDFLLSHMVQENPGQEKQLLKISFSTSH
ncbi:hypothetical protein ACO0LO_24160 [Undibacterium sp. TJN25]|uniref:hypothetical protein n=1 Tax=Undibacterium sp. TJN25 TaxID=3413056 RepID=UPI003BF28EB1